MVPKELLVLVGSGVAGLVILLMLIFVAFLVSRKSTSGKGQGKLFIVFICNQLTHFLNFVGAYFYFFSFIYFLFILFTYFIYSFVYLF